MQKQLELVLDAKAVLGETPIWDVKNQLLYWTDGFDKKLHILNPSTITDSEIDVHRMIGTVVIRDSGGVLVALEDGLHLLDPETGELALLVNPEEDKPNNRFNDGKCDCKGRLWVSSVSKDFGKTMEPLGKLYCLNTDHSVKTALESVIQVNGMCWSHDNKKMYLVDTPGFKILSFDFNIGKGEIDNCNIAVKVPESFGYPDGMCMDTEGMLWLAHWGYRLTRWNPATGELLENIPVPAANVTCCVFGGADLDELYVTTACYGVSGEEWIKYPYSGGVFKFKPGVKGMEAYKYKG